MPRKPTYDPEPLNRFRYNPAVVEEVTDRIHEQAVRPLTETLDELSGNLAAEHDITEEVAALWLTHQVKHLLDEQLYFRAACARSAGVPKVGIADVMQWRGSSSVLAKRWPELDDLVGRISQDQQEADQTGQPQSTILHSGYTETIYPRH